MLCLHLIGGPEHLLVNGSKASSAESFSSEEMTWASSDCGPQVDRVWDDFSLLLFSLKTPSSGALALPPLSRQLTLSLAPYRKLMTLPFTPPVSGWITSGPETLLVRLPTFLQVVLAAVQVNAAGHERHGGLRNTLFGHAATLKVCLTYALSTTAGEKACTRPRAVPEQTRKQQ